MYRETKNARLAVEYVIGSLDSAVLAGGMIVYTGNCQPTIQHLLKMKGTVDVFPEVKRLDTLAASHDVQVDFVWRPRTHEWLQHADELSRVPDSSDFLRYNQFERLCKLKCNGVAWDNPTRDVFAGAARGQQVKRFYTLHYAPGCLGC